MKTIVITEEMLKHTKHGYRFMMEIRMWFVIYGRDKFNKIFNTNIKDLDELLFDPDILK